MKRQISTGPLQNLGEAFDRAIEEMKGGVGTEDFKEGVAHFPERRPSAFTSR
jgi:hypothetical protein